MTCETVKLPGGGFAIVCGRGSRGRRARCRWCVSRPGAFQCDWKLENARACDKHLCAEHAFQVDDDKHLCPAHVGAYRRWLVVQHCVPLT